MRSRTEGRVVQARGPPDEPNRASKSGKAVLSSNRPAPLTLDQHAAEDLARRRLGDLVEDLDGAHLLVRRHPIRDELSSPPRAQSIRWLLRMLSGSRRPRRPVLR